MEAALPVCLLGEDGTLHYFEAVSSSPLITNPIAAAVGNGGGKGTWTVRVPAVGKGEEPGYQPELYGQAVKLPDRAALRTGPLRLDDHTKPAWHVAVISRAANLLLAPDTAALWRKLRVVLTCPTREGWGTALMPKIMAADVLQPLRQHGWDSNVQAWALAEDADEKFDAVVAAYVKRHGLEDAA